MLTALRNRGVADAFIVCCDGLKGLPEAIRATWPYADVETCVAHLVRSSLRYTSKKHWGQVCREIREIYTAPTVEAAEARFDEFAETWAEHRRLGTADRHRARPQPPRRCARRRHARSALGGRVLRHGHQLPRSLGHDARGAHRDPPRSRARWPSRHHGVGPHQELVGRVGAGASRGGSSQKVANQAAMLSLGRPGAGEQLLAAHGFVDITRISVPFVWEFPDPEMFARALGATGPGFEAIESVAGAIRGRRR